MRHPLLTMSRRELGADPLIFLAPAIVSAVSAAILHAFAVFLVCAIRTPEIVLAPDDDLTASFVIQSVLLVAAFTAIPAIIVLGSIGSGVVLSMQHRVVRWRIAGATPRQCGLIVIGQLTVASFTGAIVGTVLSIPLLPFLMHIINTMAGIPDAALSWDATSLALTVAASGVLGVLGAIRPARTAGRILLGPALREEEPHSGGHPILRAQLTIGLGVGTIAMVRSALNSDPHAELSGGLDVALGAGFLALGTVAAGSPWIIPAVARWSSIVPGRFGPSWSIARGFTLANPGRTSATNLPFVVAASVAGVFSATIATWQHSLEVSGSGEALNTSDTIAMIGPAVVIGVVGAACQILLSRRQRLADFTLVRVAGGNRKTLVATAFSEALVGAGTVFLLSTGIAFLEAILTAHALHVESARIDWPLQLSIITAGFLATTAISVSAALTASRGNPRQYLGAS